MWASYKIKTTTITTIYDFGPYRTKKNNVFWSWPMYGGGKATGPYPSTYFSKLIGMISSRICAHSPTKT
jgi:hypothetical protein